MKETKKQKKNGNNTSVMSHKSLRDSGTYFLPLAISTDDAVALVTPSRVAARTRALSFFNDLFTSRARG